MSRLSRFALVALAFVSAALCFQPALGADAPALANDTARIHYHRPRGDYDGWGLHAWDGAVKETAWGAAAPRP